MKNHIINNQNIITTFLFVILLFLIIVSIFIPNIDIKGPFSIIAGWLGIIIGFFFNQQFTEHLRQKLNENEKKKKILEKNYEQKLQTLNQKAIEEINNTTKYYENEMNHLSKKTLKIKEKFK